MSSTRPTIETLFSEIDPNACRNTGPSAAYTASIDRFLQENQDDPEELLALLAVFIKDPTFPMDKNQRQSLIDLAFKQNKLFLLLQLDEMLENHRLDISTEDGSDEIVENPKTPPHIKQSLFYAESEDLNFSPKKRGPQPDNQATKRVRLSGI